MKTAKLIIYIFICFFSTTAIAQFTFYRDMDNDGLGGYQSINNSYPPPGYVANNDDCNDNDSNIGRATTWYRDADNDGLGDPNVSSVSCTQPNGYVSNDDDVDDGDGDVTDIPPTVFYRDVDGDSWGSGFTINSSYPPPGYTSRGGDCNDGDGSIYPGAPEFCDGKDNDCNGQTDDGAVEVPNPPGVANNCGNTVLTKPSYTGGVTLYWQSSASGTSTSNSSNTIVLTSGTVYYIRAKANNATGCWSNARTINYTVNPSIGTSGGSNKSRCGSGTVTLTASLGSNANQIRWYTSASGGSAIHTGTSFTTPNLSTTTPYYAESRNTSTGCVASSRRYMQAVINPIPGIASGSNKSRCSIGTVTLTASPGSNANQVRWYTGASGGSAIHTGNSFTTPNLSTTISYYAESYNSTTTCVASSRRLIQAIINPAVSAASGNNVSRCGNGTVTLIATVGSNGNTIRWYSASSGGTLLHTGTSFLTSSLSATTTYYAESYNSSTQCGASTRKAIQAQISNTSTYYADTDNDGLGDPANSIVQCTQPAGYVSNSSDNCPNVYAPNNECIQPPSSDPETHNYIYTRTYQNERGSIPALKFQEDDGYIQSISYFDGLGRPKQQVEIRQSTDKKDIVTHINYDSYGRQEKEWLPLYEPNESLGSYRTLDMASAIGSYYKLNYGNDFPTLNGTGVNAYSEKELESSPLNRVMKQAAPGEDWKLGNGHEIEFDYLTNTATDNMSQFEVTLVFADNTYTPILVKIGSFGPEELSKIVTRDENHSSGDDHTTIEFTDKQGRVVLKRTYNAGIEHDTYYVYDDYGNLTYVLPPKMDGSTATIANINTNMDALGYQYVYDYRNRLVEKKIPGKGWEHIIYNKLDQPIMTQDSVQRTNDEWLFTKYDVFGRVAYTGKATDTRDREVIQSNDVNVLTGDLWVVRDTGFAMDNITVGYGNTTYPISTVTEVLTINYYDSYDFDRANEPTPPAMVFDESLDSRTKGLATGSRVKVLETNNWITTITRYDDMARPIYTYNENEYLGTVDLIETDLDFVGKPLKVRTEHTRANTTIATLDNFEYDHVGRLLSQTQCIGNENLGYDCNGTIVEPNLVLENTTVTADQITPNSVTIKPVTTISGDVTLGVNPSLGGSGGPEELIVYNDYDELGQLTAKKVGGAPGADYAGTTGLQTVDYAYNVRGWLEAINDTNEADSNLSLDANDLWGFKIKYNDIADATKKLYNGNISQTLWDSKSTNTSGNPVSNTYTYNYDPLNRLVAASDNTGNYDVSNITYDKMGNIQTLTRDGYQNGSFANMDVLDYDYDSGNKLTKVSDTGNNGYGFIDRADQSVEFTYDINGNLLTDVNKGITGIQWNHLNMPTGITINNPQHNGTISYVYSANGTKVRKIVNDNGNITTTDYAGAYQYVNDNLEFIRNFEDGYVYPKNDGSYGYMYYYTDQLDNIRLMYSDTDNDGNIDASSEIVKEQHFYPYGLKLEGFNGTVQAIGSGLHKYDYQNQERQDELGLNWLQFKYRMQDPALGRFVSIDPLASDYTHNSTFAFAENKVIKYNELEGLEITLNKFDKLSRDNQQGFNGHATFLANAAIGAVNGAIDIFNYAGDLDRADQSGQGSLNKLVSDGSNAVNAVADYASNTSLSEFGSDVAKVATDPNTAEDVFGGVVSGTAFTKIGKLGAVGKLGVADELQGAANQALKTVGDGKGAVHGTKVHSEFGTIANKIDNVTKEVSYKDGEVVPYGTKGSVRADAVEGDINKPTTIYDLKTGDAKLTQKNIDKYNQHVPGKPPVNEIKPVEY